MKFKLSQSSDHNVNTGMSYCIMNALGSNQNMIYECDKWSISNLTATQLLSPNTSVVDNQYPFNFYSMNCLNSFVSLNLPEFQQNIDEDLVDAIELFRFHIAVIAMYRTKREFKSQMKLKYKGKVNHFINKYLLFFSAMHTNQKYY